MTTTETLKLALEALKRMKGYGNTFAYRSHEQDPHEQVCDAITALEALASEAIEQKSGIKQVIELYDSPDQPAPVAKPHEQEPVAAECKFDREQKWVRCEIAHHNLVQSEPHNWPDYQTRLLYTSPPAQRTWVGLTEEEIKTSLPYSVTRDKGCFHAGALWAEAKLKEKNCG